jgi:NADH-quinone oxidoreductase subunit N
MTPSASVFETVSNTLWILTPELFLLAVASVMMTLCAFVTWPRAVWATIAGSALLACLPILLITSNVTLPDYAASILNDPLAFWSRLGLLGTGLILTILAADRIEHAKSGEFFGSLLMIQTGVMLTASANDLALLFLGLELVSIPTYLLLFLGRRSDVEREAATKYFLLSLFSSAVLLFGMAYLYGLTGVSNLRAIGGLLSDPAALPGGSAGATLGIVALVFVVGGLGFRLASVPFHFYAPDVYQGTATILTALLSWIPKAVGVLALIRLVIGTLGFAPELRDPGIILGFVVAVATLTVGNFLALAQTNLKRLMAYSSISHAGYLMVGLTAAFVDGSAGRQVTGVEAMLVYLGAYGVTTLGFFAGLLALTPPHPGRPTPANLPPPDAQGPVVIDDLAGLARSRPGVALGLAACLVSLAGLPPTLGFLGKFEVFAAAIAAGGRLESSAFVTLVAIAALNAAIGAYYYLRLIVAMYLRDPIRPSAADFDASTATPTPPVNLGACSMLTVCALASVFLGLAPNWLTGPSSSAALGVRTLPPPPPVVVTEDQPTLTRNVPVPSMPAPVAVSTPRSDETSVVATSADKEL